MKESPQSRAFGFYFSSSLDLADFYQTQINVGGLPVLGSAKAAKFEWRREAESAIPSQAPP